jgi:hypothetical protein
MLIRVSGYVITVLILIHKQGTAHSCNNKPAIRGRVLPTRGNV